MKKNRTFFTIAALAIGVTTFTGGEGSVFAAENTQMTAEAKVRTDNPVSWTTFMGAHSQDGLLFASVGVEEKKLRFHGVIKDKSNTVQVVRTRWKIANHPDGTYEWTKNKTVNTTYPTDKGFEEVFPKISNFSGNAIVQQSGAIILNDYVTLNNITPKNVQNLNPSLNLGYWIIIENTYSDGSRGYYSFIIPFIQPKDEHGDPLIHGSRFGGGSYLIPGYADAPIGLHGFERKAFTTV
ncbi:hypothetical protein [Bacillus sp. 196mf]|uniref:hypothetical protein n=1 Tax=Bacillus sp. 196mf TaxID=1761754 RepID=UPI000D7CC640|nr:hypothetical protein [Bacillus sp. 196mf]PYE87375.1 hypothetical protein ATL10_10743 [Bacillus sp. 196mf]